MVSLGIGGGSWQCGSDVEVGHEHVDVLHGLLAAPDRKQLVRVLRRDGWNDYTVIANGNVFVHIINGEAE